MDDLIREVRQYRPADVLIQCRKLSLELAGRSEPLLMTVPSHLDRFGIERRIAVTLFYPALIVRISLLVGSRLGSGTLSDGRFLRILRIVSELYEPADGLVTLLQIFYEQGWYQKDIGRAIGRAIILYRDIPRELEYPRFDVEAEIQARLGLPVEDYFGIAFLLFALVFDPDKNPFFYPTIVRTARLNDRIQELLVPDKVRAFLKTASADQEQFRRIASEKSLVGTGLARYDYNPLFEAPLIEIDGSGFIAPVPDMLVWRIEDAPYWELRNHYRGVGAYNPFADFFGKEIFERYVGLQLMAAFPGSSVIPELRYPGPLGEMAGPDWVVILGEVGLAIECTVGSLSIAAMTGFDTALLESSLRDRYIRKINAIPQTIEDLGTRFSQYGIHKVKKWHRLLVYKEPLYTLPILREKYIDPAVSNNAKPYHLLSIEEFEDLVTLEASYGVARLLSEKEAAQNELNQSFREFLGNLGRQHGLNFANKLVKQAKDQFLSALVSDTLN